jgi:hypothetical protein
MGFGCISVGQVSADSSYCWHLVPPKAGGHPAPDAEGETPSGQPPRRRRYQPQKGVAGDSRYVQRDHETLLERSGHTGQLDIVARSQLPEAQVNGSRYSADFLARDRPAATRFSGHSPLLCTSTS